MVVTKTGVYLDGGCCCCKDDGWFVLGGSLTLCTADSMDKTANKNIVSGFNSLQNSDVINARLLIDCSNTLI